MRLVFRFYKDNDKYDLENISKGCVVMLIIKLDIQYLLRYLPD